ncbi:PREDICTED: uncharacterized protein LOC109478477 [Branchiostoma belcheri]|uniref:Uncharacterized protein LOC109478477 n=1 Tax=Branchiostoma belcheri TaxID=7741 RepID=A0A6P4ZFQ4_BRABE|nr:PREDICTED: uncharacterized protein LOC109478477 [Branchiostoma belcheri]
MLSQKLVRSAHVRLLVLVCVATIALPFASVEARKRPRKTMRTNPAYVACKLVNRTRGPLDLMARRQRAIVRLYNNVTLTPDNVESSKLLFSRYIIKNTEPVERMQLLLTELRVFQAAMEEIRRQMRRDGRAAPRPVYRKLYQQVEAMDTYGDIAKGLVNSLQRKKKKLSHCMAFVGEFITVDTAMRDQYKRRVQETRREKSGSADWRRAVLRDGRGLLRDLRSTTAVLRQAASTTTCNGGRKPFKC